MKSLTAFVLGLTVLFSSTCAQSGAPVQSTSAIPAYLQPEVAAALGQISPDSIRTVMSILASARLEGRQPGTRGFAMASDYVQDKMKAMGLLPGVDGGSFVQSVLLKKGMVVPEASSL